MKKIVTIVADGIGDISCIPFAYKTPLEHTPHPFLDALVESGVTGLMDTLEPGFACGSDTAHMILFGYNPRGIYRGRGAFEALGGGINMKAGDIAFKSNFCTYDENTNMVLTRRADRVMEAIGPDLASSINGVTLPNHPDIEVTCKYLCEHRCAVRIRGPGMSGEVTGTDPLVDYKELQKSRPLDNTPEAQRTADIINELSQTMFNILNVHPINEQRRKDDKNPANLLSLRGPGIQISLTPFTELHPKILPLAIAPTAIVAGVALTAAMDVFACPHGTGDYFTDFEMKADFLSKIVETTPHNFCFLHVKATDDTGHDGRPQLRSEIIERVDRMVGLLLSRLVHSRHEIILQFTADHSTPICVKDHSCEPVPFFYTHLSNFHARFEAKPTSEAGDRWTKTDPAEWAAGFDAEKHRFAVVDGWSNSDYDTAESEVHESEPDFRETGGCTRKDCVHLVRRETPLNEDTLPPLARGILKPDSAKSYTETVCGKGCLGRFPGLETMKFNEKLLTSE